MRWKLFDYLSQAVVFLGSIALILLVVFTGWQVYGRYILNDTPTWTEKMALLLILIVSLPMAAVGLRENFHLGITFISELLPMRYQRWVEIINAFILALFGGSMIVFSWTLVKGTWGRNIPLLGIPQGIQYLPLIICGGLIIAFMVERLYFLIVVPQTELLEAASETETV
ncbi:TRAP transporter small permease [Pseudovibrio sp. Tun.PSC04-5.I4]|uniref:TRAP transporter small permease n=1 Tax=Pseudovibrio sp. Tun.PSC04-5.I4 TaxID=1798213 RepID=UPI0008851B67|nr:TRAP transporter small permease [Pseudovibrio sp. Tun.PSC04-5.I4]SDQ16866.1 TRAP-type C4-dicarboxylate transport system, small permease component [Pseudovibrio sp. Tun.PSC04-5.I4]